MTKGITHTSLTRSNGTKTSPVAPASVSTNSLVTREERISALELGGDVTRVCQSGSPAVAPPQLKGLKKLGPYQGGV